MRSRQPLPQPLLARRQRREQARQEAWILTQRAAEATGQSRQERRQLARSQAKVILASVHLSHEQARQMRERGRQAKPERPVPSAKRGKAMPAGLNRRERRTWARREWKRPERMAYFGQERGK